MEITVSEITFLQTAGPLISAVVIVLFGYMFGRHNLGETIEQMKSDRREEADERSRQVRREAYVALLASCEEINETPVVEREDEISKKRRVEAETHMNLALATVDIVAPIALARQAEWIYRKALLERGNPERDVYLDELANMMRKDVGIPGVFRDRADTKMNETVEVAN